MKANLLNEDMTPLTQTYIENVDNKNKSQYNIIKMPLEDYSNQAKLNNCTPKDMTIDIILKAQTNKKSGSITNRIYELILSDSFDKDFTADVRSGRNKQTIINTAKIIKSLDIPNTQKSKLYTFNLNAYKSFQLLKRIGKIESSECNFCSMELDQEHIQWDCPIAAYVINLLQYDIEYKFNETITIKDKNFFNLELDNRQKNSFTETQQKEIIHTIAAVRVGLHNFFYKTKFIISKYDQRKIIDMYNKSINILRLTFKSFLHLGNIKVTPKTFPTSKENFPTLNMLTRSMERLGYRHTSLTQYTAQDFTNERDIKLYRALGYTEQYLKSAGLLRENTL